MQIIVRHAKDDFYALMTAQGMEDAGAEVFSITLNQTTQRMLQFLVFAKYDPNKITPDGIDACIQKQLFPAQDENTTDGGNSND
jgi:hypothetical protein